MQTDDQTIHDLQDVPAGESTVDDSLDSHTDGESFGITVEAVPVSKWRLAQALSTLRKNVDAAAPQRSKVSDGSIGNAAHASRTSDHNPWVVEGGIGVVTAIDITHDPNGGCDAYRLADVLRLSKDARIKYIISNRRIASAAPKGSVPAWTWRTYTGANAHNHHTHVSVVEASSGYDDADDWPIGPAFLQTESVPATDDPDERLAEVERGLLATIDAENEADPATPLLIRLTKLRDSITTLIDVYNQAARPAKTDGDGVVPEAAAPSFDAIGATYQEMFATCQIPASTAGIVAWHRKMLQKGRPQYEQVAALTGIPWWFVGIIHGMEGSFNFTTHLHNGDPLSARTVQVPKGRPKTGEPPFTWRESAVDALSLEGFGGSSEWSVAHALYRWEAYNGWGYRRAGIDIATPYLWSFSGFYTRGKFVRDGVFDRNAISKQCGAAVMLKALQNGGDVAV